MKRKFTKILLLILAVMTFSLALTFSSSAAKEYTSGDFRFRVGSKSATLVEYTGSAETVKIPSKVKGKPVTVIDKEAFWGKTKMKSVTIPSTVTKIGQAAFNECTSLTKVSLPKNLKTISSGAFWYCTNLKKIFIYDKVKTIGENAFRGCNSLTAYVVKGSFAEKHIKTLDNVDLAYRYATSVRLSKTSLNLALGTTYKLTYTITPEKVYNSKVTFKSGNEKVVKVSSNGTLKAVACGTAVVTCTTKDGSKKVSSCTVKVIPEKVSELKVTAQKKNSYKLSWKECAGATGYRINRYNSSTKKWELAKRTTKTAYTFKNLEAGSSTRYAVTSYVKVGKEYYYGSSYTYITASTLSPDKVTGLSGAGKSNSVTLKWTAIDDADGYCVYIYDEDKKEYYNMATVTSASAEITKLQSNKAYAFAVKAFYKDGENLTYSKYYSDVFKVTTLPGVVQGFTVLSDSLTHESATLSWTKLNDCSGYIVYLYNKGSKQYEVYETIKGNDTTKLEVTDLESAKTYYFKIRAYASVATNLGDYSDKLTVTTKEKTVTEDTAIELFVGALNATKNSKASFSMIKECHVINKNRPDELEYAKLLGDIARDYSTSYSIVNGTDSKSGVAVSSLIEPLGQNSTLTKEMIKEGSLTCYEDGEGFFISFELPEEDENGSATSRVTQAIDWQTIAQKHASFKLNSCVYEGTKIKGAKIIDNVISYMIVEIPVRVNFNLGDKTYEFTQTIEYRYFFGWN